MNIMLLLGLVISFGGVIAGYLIEKGVLASLVQISAICIVFGGTFGVSFVAFPFANFKKIPHALKMIMFHKKHNYREIIDMLSEIANKARKDGLLSLEAEADKMSDPFIKKGLGYIADGVDPEFLRKVLENEIESQYKNFEDAAKVFEGMGGTSPTMGVLGTVMGMVSILRELNAGMDGLGSKIASAFVATMFGVGAANLLWLPIASNIKVVAGEESEYREVIIEGLMAIQSGEPSSRLKDRLLARVGDTKVTAKAKAE